MFLEITEPCAEPLELDIHVSKTACESLELVRLNRTVDAPRELADPSLDPQSLRLEL